MVLVGYALQSKRYQLHYNLNSKKVVIKHDVTSETKFGARVTDKIVEATLYANEFSVDMRIEDSSDVSSDDNSDAPSYDEGLLAHIALQ